MAIDRDGDGPPLRKAPSGADDANTLRATPFTEDVFDDDYYRGRGRSSGGSPFGLIVGVIVGAAVAGAAAWFVLKDQSVGTLSSAGGTPVIKADPSPYKIKPENPGGLQVENQDKTVYDRVAKTDAPNRVENLLPPPEQPKTPPKVEPKPAPAAPVEAKGVEAKPDESKPGDSKTGDSKSEVANPADTKSADTTVADKPAAKTPEQEKKDDLAVMIAALDGKKPGETAPPADKSAESTSTPATPPTPEAAPAAALTSGFQVQLAAAKSEEAAMSEWTRIKNRHPDLLGNLKPSVVRADLGDKGVFYRLRAGFLPDKAASDSLCATMAAQGDACIVIKP
jgi:hypothetical protein